MEVKTRFLGGLVIIAVLLALAAASQRWMGKGREALPTPTGASPLPEQPSPAGGEEKAAPPGAAEDWSPDLDRFRDKRLALAGMVDPPEFEPRDEPGWPIWGIVTRPRWMPLRGAEVSFHLQDGHIRYAAVAPVLTDAKGCYVSFVPAPESVHDFSPDRSLPMEIQGLALQPGYQPRRDSVVYLPHPVGTDEPLRLDFALKPGGMVQGRVQDQAGAPVAGAEVFLLEPGTGWEKITDTGEDGGYIIPVEGKGPVTLSAMKDEKGLAPPLAVEAGPEQAMEAPPLVLQEYGALEGTLAYPDDKPVAGLEVFAFPRDRLDSPASNLLAYAEKFLALESLPAEGGAFRGLPFGRTRTTSEGRFRMAGLLPGDYFLWGPRLRPKETGSLSSPAPPWPLPCSTGDANLRAKLDLHHLEVTVRDMEGFLLPDVLLTYESDALEGKEFLVRGRALVQVVPGLFTLVARTEERMFGEAEVRVEAGDFFTRVEVLLE